jgi:hypothetical protein
LQGLGYSKAKASLRCALEVHYARREDLKGNRAKLICSITYLKACDDDDDETLAGSCSCLCYQRRQWTTGLVSFNRCSKQRAPSIGMSRPKKLSAGYIFAWKSANSDVQQPINISPKDETRGSTFGPFFFLD